MTEQNAIANYYKYTGKKTFNFTTALVDMDGVLFDSMKNHTRAWVKLMKKNGIKCTRDEFYMYEGMTGRDIIKMKFKDGAGKNITDEQSLRNAIYVAIDVWRNRQNYDKPYENPLPKLYHERRDESEKVRFHKKPEE